MAPDESSTYRPLFSYNKTTFYLHENGPISNWTRYWTRRWRLLKGQSGTRPDYPKSGRCSAFGTKTRSPGRESESAERTLDHPEPHPKVTANGTPGKGDGCEPPPEPGAHQKHAFQWQMTSSELSDAGTLGDNAGEYGNADDADNVGDDE